VSGADKARLRKVLIGGVVSVFILSGLVGHAPSLKWFVLPLSIMVVGLGTWSVLLDPPWKHDPRWFARLNQSVQVLLLLATLWWAAEALLLPACPLAFVWSLAGSAILCAVIASWIGKRERERYGGPKIGES